MSSATTRLEIVQRAVKQAGRSAELYAHAKELLNDLLRGAALANRYKVLRKVGSAMTLSTGTQTVALPADFGCATDNLLFGNENFPLTEFELDDFIERGGFPAVGTANSRPNFYTTDVESKVWRFAASADVDYQFIPVYFKLPPNYLLSALDDNTLLWYENDDAIVEGLIWKIYKYTDDAREFAQKQLWDQLDGQYRRGTMPIQGGASKVRLSPGAFRQRGNSRR